MSNVRSRRGFTLIDVAAVVTIGAAVGAVVFPAFPKNKEGAFAQACLSNTRQIATAITMYADDNNRVLVPAAMGEDQGGQPNFPNRRFWRKLLLPYLKSPGVLICPSMPQEAGYWGPPPQDSPATYGLNQAVCSSDSDFQGRYTHKISQYPKPSTTILLTEVRAGLWQTSYALCLRQNINTYAPHWHTDRLSVLFMDGHARIMYLYDTLGNTPSEWMWWDPEANPEYGDAAAVAALQEKLKREWPRAYPRPAP